MKNTTFKRYGFDLESLKRAFDGGHGRVCGSVVNMTAGALPRDLERDGWIERVQSKGRWDEVFQPTQKLKECV